MSITDHRTVEHTYTTGDQSVLKIQTINYDSLIDGSSFSIIVSDEDGNHSVSIQSRDQLERLISNLRWVADAVLGDVEPVWSRPVVSHIAPTPFNESEK